MGPSSMEGIDCGRAFQYLMTVASRDRRTHKLFVNGPAHWLSSQFAVSVQEAEQWLERLVQQGYGSLDDSGSRFELANSADIVAKKMEAFLEKRDERNIACRVESAPIHAERTSQTPRALEDCFEVVCEYYRLDPGEVLSPTRKQPLAHHRQLMMHLMRRVGYSFPVIARFMKRDHTTVMHACEVIETELGKGPSLKKDLDSIWTLLKNR